MPNDLKTIAWFKHGPYSEGEHLFVSLTDPKNDDLYSALIFKDEVVDLLKKCLPLIQGYDIVGTGSWSESEARDIDRILKQIYEIVDEPKDMRQYHSRYTKDD